MADETTVTDIDAEMLALAQKVDAGEMGDAETTPNTAPDVAGATDETVAGEVKKETAAETQPAATDKKTQEPSPQKDGAKSEADDEPKEGDSAFVKAQKERARFDRNWQKLQDEKAELAREKAALAEARAKPAEPAKVETAADKTTPKKDARGYSASDYEAAAKDFEAEGESELAAKARGLAEQLKQSEGAEAATRQQAEFGKTWQETVQKTVEAEAELKNYESPLSKGVQALLKSDPFYSQIPDGFARAVRDMKRELAAGSVPELTGQIEKLRAELATATKRLGIGGSNPAKPAVERKMADMTPDEQDAEMRRMLAEADAIGA